VHPAATDRDDELVRGRRRLGKFELIFLSDGPYLLDGGAMFGVVPKTLWSKRTPPDELNRILLGENTVVVRTGAAVVVIETGIGNKQPPKMREIFQNKAQLMESFAAAGVRLEEVTHVVNTHLHFDHCGWNTTLRADGSVAPTFPNARYFAAAGELAHGRLQLERGFTTDDARLRGEEALPPVSIQTGAEIVPGIRVENFPGHTASLLGVHVESEGEHACYCGDLIPTHNHLDPTWVMGYDLDPLRCIEERRKFLQRAIAEDWLVLFPHDHAMPAARLAWNDKGKPVVREG